MTGPWILDGKIDLSAICAESNWHRLTAIERLTGMEGVGNRREAETFIDFVFCDKATDERPEDHVTDEQYERLSVI